MSEQEGDEWRDWGPDIIDAVKKGWLDSSLRDIVRAAFARKMKSHLLPDDMADAMAREAEEAVRAKLASAPSLSNVITFVPKVKDGYTGIGTFDVNGSLYYKVDVIGKNFEPNPIDIGSRKGTSWTGVTFYVLEINSKNITVIINDPPRMMDSRLRAVFYAGRPIVVSKNTLRAILEK